MNTISTSKTDAAWLAGFLDGEGSFMIAVDKTSSGGFHSAVVAASGTDLRLLERCKAIAGGHIVTVRLSAKNPKWKDAYHWRVKGRGVVPLIEAVMPFLVSKREQASLLLELRSGTRLGALPGVYGRQLGEIDREHREQLRQRVKELNHRGTIPVKSNAGVTDEIRFLANST